MHRSTLPTPLGPWRMQPYFPSTALRSSARGPHPAGSERIAKSEVAGQQLREAQAINKSLSALGDVIASLQSKSGHVPYRNSKLTQVGCGGQAGAAPSASTTCLVPSRHIPVALHVACLAGTDSKRHVTNPDPVGIWTNAIATSTGPGTAGASGQPLRLLQGPACLLRQPRGGQRAGDAVLPQLCQPGGPGERTVSGWPARAGHGGEVPAHYIASALSARRADAGHSHAPLLRGPRFAGGAGTHPQGCRARRSQGGGSGRSECLAPHARCSRSGSPRQDCRHAAEQRPDAAEHTAPGRKLRECGALLAGRLRYWSAAAQFEAELIWRQSCVVNSTDCQTGDKTSQQPLLQVSQLHL